MGAQPGFLPLEERQKYWRGLLMRAGEAVRMDESMQAGLVTGGLVLELRSALRDAKELVDALANERGR
ncbi:hypothetical protein AB4090_04760 [Acidithiobacillus sp. IBUN Pt1247-S3]|uniref:hypothetical protein n=1 Tax=Acidithiobacillus sp. IBUN Pt1247-S3 TaxID=3166642 RepID=UPI0034E3B8ED